MSWALEATAFIAPDGSLDDRLCRKRHLAVLVRMGGFLDARRHGSVESPTSAKLLAPAAPLSAPWSIGVLLSCVGAGVFAANLSSRWQPDGYAPWAWIALVAVGALAGGTTLVLSPIKQVGRVICVIVLAAAVSVVIAASQHVALAAMTWVPIVLLLGPVTIVRRMSYADVLGLRPARWTRPRDPREADRTVEPAITIVRRRRCGAGRQPPSRPPHTGGHPSRPQDRMAIGRSPREGSMPIALPTLSATPAAAGGARERGPCRCGGG